MDGTENKQGEQQTSTSEAPSADQQGTPTTPQTFTQEQVQKQVSDALARAGRVAKDLETRTADITAREARILKAEQERELAELEAVKDKPDELPIVQRRQKLAADIRTHNAEVERRNLEWATREAEINEAKATRFEVTVITLAEKHGVSAEVLKAKAFELAITSAEGIAKLAEILPKKSILPVPDSGKSVGGEDTSKLSPEEKFRRGVEREKR